MYKKRTGIPEKIMNNQDALLQICEKHQTKVRSRKQSKTVTIDLLKVSIDLRSQSTKNFKGCIQLTTNIKIALSKTRKNKPKNTNKQT